MKSTVKSLIVLNIVLMVYSFSGVLSKTASGYPFFSFRFLLFYGLMIVLLALYAVFWQQIIRKLPLTLAYANKAVTVIWGMIWGMLMFGESMSFKKILGAVFVVIGIILFVREDSEVFHG